jgi:hypothetical protein
MKGTEGATPQEGRRIFFLAPLAQIKIGILGSAQNDALQ